jgi:hypothetical protein
VLAGLLLAGCASSGSGKASAQASQASGVLHSATANPSVQAAIARAKKDVVNPCIDASTGPVSFKNCVYAKVPPAQRSAVKKCMAKALLADHISTAAGKAKWLDTDVPACVGAVLP